MSKVELTQLGGPSSQADAVHLRIDGTGQAAANLVFGTSNIVSDLRDAVNAAFDRVLEIENNTQVECQIAEAMDFTQEFDPAVTTTLKQMLVPERGGAPQYNTAYGLFLAYDVGLAANAYPISQYPQALASKMQYDIQAHTQYIAQKISSLNLTNHPFCIYVLPLDNAISDKAAIIQRALGVGGGTSVI